MGKLSPCAQCRRHVRADEATCPFCGSEVTTAEPVPSRPALRLTRAALFAGATLLAPACGGHQHHDKDHSHDRDAEQDTTQDTAVSQADAGPAQTPEEAADPKRTAEEQEEQRRRLQEAEERLLEEENYRRGGECTPDGQCPPYGAPPSLDDRVV